MENKLICKIYQVAAGQLLVNIPKSTGLKAGDYVVIRKLELFDTEGSITIGTLNEAPKGKVAKRKGCKGWNLFDLSPSEFKKKIGKLEETNGI